MGAGRGKWGRWCERIGYKGEVDVLGGTKDGGRCAKNGDGVWLVGRWRERIGCKGEVGVLGGAMDGGTSAKNVGEGAKEWGAGEMWVCSEIRRMGRGCERMDAGEKWMCQEV